MKPAASVPSARTAKRQAAPAGRSGSAKSELLIDGRGVPVSNLDKILYPKTGFTKGQVIDFYIRISPVLLPHLKWRPLTMKRYPDGVEGGFFYEKRCPPYRPSWIQTTPMWSDRRNAPIQFCVINDLASLVWAANLADLELHTYLAKAKQVNSPTMVVFDLDPGPPATIIECAQVAFILKEILDALGLMSYPKTSGSKGLQLYIPLNTRTSYEQTKPFAHGLAETVARQHPGLVVSRMQKSLRHGKVLIDWSQNDRHKTTVCAYSLRAKDQPTVSTPVTWDEVQQASKEKNPGCLSFLADEVLERVAKMGDLFAPVLELKQKLPSVAAPTRRGRNAT
jgi:bifunctional non-homologous end joining protein LigD